MSNGSEELGLRARAEKRIKDRRQFWSSSLTLVAVFVLLVLVWGVTGGWRGYFWPMWPAIAFAVAITFHALSVFGPAGQPISRDAVDAEIRKLGGDPSQH